MKVKGILSYPHLFTARKVNATSDPKFSVNVLLRKDDPQVAVLQAAIQEAKLNGFPSGFPATGKTCLIDLAAMPTPNGPVPHADARLHNYFELRTSSKEESRPHVVMLPEIQPITDPALVFPGCVGWVDFSVFSYSLDTSKGIAAGLNGVAICPGEESELGRLDNKQDAATMFGDLAAGGAPQAPMQQAAPPMQQAAPPMQQAAPPMQQAAPPMQQAAPPMQTSACPLVMSPTAPYTYDALKASGWTDQAIVDAGYATYPAPGGAPLAFS
jgi:hypothetical protein